MKIEEHDAIICKLRTKLTEPEDVELLSQLSTDYQTVSAEHDDAVAKCDEAVKKAQQYADINTKLFLERSNKNTTITEKDTSIGEENHAEKKTYSALEESILKEIGGTK